MTRLLIKQIIFMYAFVITLVYFLSCGSKSATPVPVTRDTTKTVALYVDTDSIWKFDYVYRQVKDTFLVVKNGSKMSVKPVRDSTYYYPTLFNATDSLGNKLKRVNGTDSTMIYFVPGKQIMKEDFNIDVDRIDSIIRVNNSEVRARMIKAGRQ